MANSNVITNSAEYGLIPQRDFFDKNIAVEGNTDKYYIIGHGDFVYNPRKSTTAPYGPFNCYRGEEEGVVSPLYTCLKPLQPELTEYLLWYFRSSAWHSYIYHNGAQGGARHDRVGMTNDLMDGIPINLPCQDEQKKISKFLSTIDARLSTQQRLVDSLKLYKRGLNIRMLNDLPECTKQPLSLLCEIVGGGTPDTSKRSYWNGDIQWFTPSEVGKKKYVKNSLKRISSDGYSASSAHLLPAGTVLLTTRATLGEMSIATEPCTTNQGFQSLIPKSNTVTSEYLYYLQVLIKPWCEKYASGNTFREISKANLGKCPVPLPSREIQSNIVRVLSMLDRLLSIAEENYNLLLAEKQALLHDLFI